MDFAAGFPRVSEAEWRAAVDRVLKGADFNRTLVGRTADGIAIAPLHPRRPDAAPVAGARGAGRWQIVARLDDPDVARGNGLIHADLLGGADALTLSFAGARGARGFGLPVPSAAVFDAALEGVHCDLIALRLEAAPFAGRAVAEGFAAFAARQRLPGAALRVDFGMQPLADWAVAGGAPLPFAALMANTGEIIAGLAALGFAGPFLRCDGRPFHDAGASEAQELAGVIAQGVAYLRALAGQGMALGEACARLSFTLSADDDQLLTIAKFRALRLLWARIEEACGLLPRAIPIHAETAWRMLARRDPYVNLLRNTIAAFAAGIGGADSIEVLPFTAALGLPDAAARRLSRNTSLILMDEANLHRMVDPAAGSGGIEALTDDLSAAAWALFQEIEAQARGGDSGLPAALANGFLAGRIAKVRAERLRAIATRRQPVTGVSAFADLVEAPVAVLAAREMPGPVADLDFPPHRLAEPFEALRDRAEAIQARMGARPSLFLANLGPPAGFAARASFAGNAFAAGGFSVIANDGFAEGEGTDLVALTDAFKASGARLACLCASDALYAAEAGDAAIALGASGAVAVLLAGRPGAQEAAWRSAGIADFLFAGCDMIALLTKALAHFEAGSEVDA